ncbi:MAG: hypothetical protein ACLQBD_24360 [Syntrophobacteraceae bacterium]
MNHAIAKSLGHTTDAEDLADKIRAEASKLPELIESLARKYREILTRMHELKRAGLIYAKPYYRQGKYLYLIYPMKDGQRRREYIGADPEKIQEALQAINRVHEYEALSSKLARTEGCLSQGQLQLNQLIRTLSVK